MDFKWQKLRNGKLYTARVNIDVRPGFLTRNEIIENLTGEGFRSQGVAECVPLNGYDSWKAGAKRGLDYGFTLVDKNWRVVLNSIEGFSTDTNPTVVGYVTLLAFLDQIQFRLDNEQSARLENFVFESWNKPEESIPDFIHLRWEVHLRK